MIIDLPETTTSSINKKLVTLSETGAAVSLGRILTLVISTDETHGEEAIRVANAASSEHPCRVLVLVRSNPRGAARLDAQIRVGGDAGASEVITLRLYGPLAEHGDSVIVPLLLPDAPVVVWWPGIAPARPAEDPIGRMATRRITDAAATPKPIKALENRTTWHVPGDTDLSWSRITLWRGLLAAALEQPPYEPVREATVTAGSDSPSGDLMAAWLALCLKCPVTRVRTRAGTGMVGIVLTRASGAIELMRPDGNVATLNQPGQPERRIALAPRPDRDCLAEELRRLDPDDVFAAVVTRGLPLLERSAGTTRTKSVGTKPESAKAPTAKAGAGKDGAGKDGAGKDGAGKDGAGKDGAGKDGAGKDGAGTATTRRARRSPSSRSTPPPDPAVQPTVAEHA